VHHQPFTIVAAAHERAEVGYLPFLRCVFLPNHRHTLTRVQDAVHFVAVHFVGLPTAQWELELETISLYFLGFWLSA